LLEGGVSLMDKLRRVLLWSTLAMGSLFGGPMNPKEIEDLMRIMNQTKIEVTITDEKGDDDFKAWMEEKGDGPA
jgi:hypothetical protein